jgi:hypothetical protein
MSRKPRYRFLQRAGDRYYWQSNPIPGDSRVEQISCRVEWFWFCMSRGPRIGGDGVPYCKRPKNHEGTAHWPAPEDGWDPNMQWFDL